LIFLFKTFSNYIDFIKNQSQITKEEIGQKRLLWDFLKQNFMISLEGTQKLELKWKDAQRNSLSNDIIIQLIKEGIVDLEKDHIILRNKTIINSLK